MSMEDIREQIAAVLGAVQGIGVVHRYQRMSATWDQFLDHFKCEDVGGKERIAGCVITRVEAMEREDSFGAKETLHLFALRFYYGCKDDDGTELTFQDMLESARQAIRENESLGETCRTTAIEWGPLSGMAGLQITEIDLRMFGGVLCHFAEGRLAAVEAA